VRALLASPLGFLIGVALGAVGGGGSILAVPALVYVAGQPVPEAVTTSLLVVGVASVFGLVTHGRAGRVRPCVGVAFGAAGIGGTVAGSALSRSVDPAVLLLGFSGLMVVAAATMARRPAPVPAGPAPPGTITTRAHLDAWLVVRVLACGTAVGFVTGFFGVGGGFVVVPALVVCLGYAMPEAAATSLLVIAINAAVALVARVGTGTLDLRVAIPFTIAALLGVSVGVRLAGRVDHDRLVHVFIGMLVVVALYTAFQSVLALT
jgi:uncharacterized protein